MSYFGMGCEKQVGDYILNEIMNEGNLCQIYQGTHVPTGEKVAIKVFNKIKLNSEKNNMIKAEKEISIFKKMFHKNIIKLYEIMETNERIYLVMEFCEGGDLYNYILTRGHLSERQSCKFFHEIIEALSYLNSLKIVHRDIKPENFLLDTSGKSISLKLIDFGISNNYDGNLLNTSCGTNAFAAPEMYKGEKYNGLLCDIWSAGIVLYAMIFGYLPFSDENEQNNINNIVKGKYEIPEEANDDLRDLLSHIIEINPDKRFNLEQIKNHKWYNIINATPIPGIDIDKYKIPIDERIINVCQAYGYDPEKINESVSENFYDNYTSIYYIILAKFIRERYDSISDLFSQDYLDYINDTKNMINNIYDKNNDKIFINEINNNEDIINENKKIINKENNEIYSFNNEKENKDEKNYRDDSNFEDNQELYSDKKDNSTDKNEQTLLEDKKIQKICNNNDYNNNIYENIENNNKDNDLKIITINNKSEKNVDTKEEINYNNLSDSSDNFQLNHFSENEENNNLRNSNIPNNDNKKNEILSYSSTETRNQEKNENNISPKSKEKDQNKSSLNNEFDNNNKIEKNNEIENENKKYLNDKFEIENISIFIQCEPKNKKNNIKEKICKNKKSIRIKNNEKYKNKTKLNKNFENKSNKDNSNIKNNKNIINKNDNKKNHIIYNRNSSSTNKKNIYKNYLNNKDDSNLKNKKVRDNIHKRTYNESLNNNNLDRNSSQKVENYELKKFETNKDYTKICRHLKTVEFSKNKDNKKLNKHNKMNNYSFDIFNKNYNNFKTNGNKILYYTNYEIKNKNNNNSIKSSYNKSINKNSIFKSISKKKNQKLLYSSNRKNSPITKQLNFNKILLNSNENKSFFNNYLNNIRIKKKNMKKYDNNKSFDFNINKENRNYLLNINQYLHKNKNYYNPNLYKGPIDLNHLIIAKNIDEVYRELINCLKKNKIFFKSEKTNNCRLYCNKEEFCFEIEIFYVNEKAIENTKHRNINLFYFTYILKALYKNTSKFYIDFLNKSILEKFAIKNYIDDAI